MTVIGQLVTKSPEVPAHMVTDVMGQEASTRGEFDSILIVTYSGRDGASILKEWMDSSTRRLVADNPNVPLNFLSFADLRGVPKLLRRAVRPMLVAAHNKAEVTAADIYTGRKPRNHLVADWTGSHRELFGLKGEAPYHCLVIYQGRIVGMFTEPTDERADEFVDLIAALTAELN